MHLTHWMPPFPQHGLHSLADTRGPALCGRTLAWWPTTRAEEPHDGAHCKTFLTFSLS